VGRGSVFMSALATSTKGSEGGGRRSPTPGRTCDCLACLSLTPAAYLIRRLLAAGVGSTRRRSRGEM
jgi:hypothetical protein